MEEEKMKVFELIPLDNRKSFYGKCRVEETETETTLFSYNSKICTYNFTSKKLTKFDEYNHGQTTKRHQKAFFNYYGINET